MLGWLHTLVLLCQQAVMFDKLKCLIQRAWPGITDPDLHRILAKRLIGPSTEVLELFDDPDVHELFGADEEEIDKFTKNTSGF